MCTPIPTIRRAVVLHKVWWSSWPQVLTALCPLLFQAMLLASELCYGREVSAPKDLLCGMLDFDLFPLTRSRPLSCPGSNVEARQLIPSASLFQLHTRSKSQRRSVRKEMGWCFKGSTPFSNASCHLSIPQ